MKKKSGFLGTIAAATLAVAGGLASSPTGQQLVQTAVDNSTKIEQQQQRYNLLLLVRLLYHIERLQILTV